MKKERNTLAFQSYVFLSIEKQRIHRKLHLSKRKSGVFNQNATTFAIEKLLQSVFQAILYIWSQLSKKTHSLYSPVWRRLEGSKLFLSISFTCTCECENYNTRLEYHQPIIQKAAMTNENILAQKTADHVQYSMFEPPGQNENVTR